jgi:hypothetical protein
MRSLLIRCYPASWRKRYGDEFLAILEERPLGPYDVADILLGALDARLPSRRGAGSPERGLSMSLRLGGSAAILGAITLTVSWFGTLFGALPFDGPFIVGLTLVGLASLLLALTILSAFQARAMPGLVWTAFALCAIGAIGYVLGGLGVVAVNEGDIPSGSIGETVAQLGLAAGGVAAVLGFALFGVATVRSGVLSRTGGVLVALGPVLMTVAWFTAAGVDWNIGGLVMLAAVGSFLVGWIALGIAAIRLDRPTVVARPA